MPSPDRYRRKRALKAAAAQMTPSATDDRHSVMTVPAFVCRDPVSRRWVVCYGKEHLRYAAKHVKGPFRYQKAAAGCKKKLNERAPAAPERSFAKLIKSNKIDVYASRI